VLLPPTLRKVGVDFLRASSVERVDLSRTAVESLSVPFCRDCRELRELLLPGTLVSLSSATCQRSPLALLFLPVASRIGFEKVYSASVMSGLVGLGSLPARPIWPAK
jgi:hypothetical protein